MSNIFKNNESSSSLGREIGALTKILLASADFVIVNTFLLQESETYASKENFNSLENDFLNSTYTDFKDFMETNRYKQYVEMNAYINDLLTKVEDKIAINPYSIRKLINDFAILQYSPSTITVKEFLAFNEIYKEEVEYNKSLFDIEAYKSNVLYAGCFAFNILFSTILKYLAKRNKNKIDMDSRDTYLLNNFLLSYGFKLYDKISSADKAEFVLNILKLYRTKGSYKNLNLLNNILANGRLTIYAVYLYFDREKWNLNDSPEDKTTYYNFLIVDVNSRETFESVYNNPELRKDRVYPYNYFTSEDNSWSVTENELFEKEIFFTKSKYNFIVEVEDFSHFSDSFQLINNISRQIFEHNEIDKYTGTINSFVDISLYEMLKVYNLSVAKKTSPSKVSPFYDLTLENPNVNNEVLSGNLSNESIRLKDKSQLITIINNQIADYKKLKDDLSKINYYRYKDDASYPNLSYVQLKELHKAFSRVQEFTGFDNNNYVEHINNSFDNQASLLVDEVNEVQVINNYADALDTTEFFISDLDITLSYRVVGISEIIEYFKSFYSKQATTKLKSIFPDYTLGVRSIDERSGTSGLTNLLENELMSLTRRNIYFLEKKDLNSAVKFINGNISTTPTMKPFLNNLNELKEILTHYDRNRNGIMTDFVSNILGKITMLEFKDKYYPNVDSFRLFLDTTIDTPTEMFEASNDTTINYEDVNDTDIRYKYSKHYFSDKLGSVASTKNISSSLAMSESFDITYYSNPL